MDDNQRLHELRHSFPPGCYDRYRLRLWREFGLPRAAGTTDAIRIAEEVLAEPGDSADRQPRPWIELRDYLIERLNDPDDEVRDWATQELVSESTAACSFALGMPIASQLFDLETTAALVPILAARLRSSALTCFDRTTAAWLLPRLGMPSSAFISVLVAVRAEIDDDSDAESLRFQRTITGYLAGLEAQSEPMTPRAPEPNGTGANSWTTNDA